MEPVTKAEFQKKTKQLPPSLFAHNIMTQAAKTVHAQSASAKGVIGRMAQAFHVTTSPYKTELYSLDGFTKPSMEAATIFSRVG